VPTYAISVVIGSGGFGEFGEYSAKSDINLHLSPFEIRENKSTVAGE